MKILRKCFSNKEQKRLRRIFDIKSGRDAGNVKTSIWQSDLSAREITSRAKLLDDKKIMDDLESLNNLSTRKKHNLKIKKHGLDQVEESMDKLLGRGPSVAVSEEIVRRGRQSSRRQGSSYGNLHERISKRRPGEAVSHTGLWDKARFGKNTNLGDDYGKYSKTLPNNFLNTAEGKKQTAVKESIKRHERVAEELRKKKVNGDKLKKAGAIGLGVAGAAGLGYAAYKHHKNKKKDGDKEK